MFSYVLKTGYKNLGAKKMFSFASIITIICSVLVFCIFYALVTNIKSLTHKVETTVGIQVFFDENLSEEQIVELVNNKFFTEVVKDIKYTSGEVAWEKFKVEYFDNKPELAAAFESDNPLVHSSSVEILLNDITKQISYIEYLKTIDGVRQINYSTVLIDALTSLNVGISAFSLILIALLLLIAVILISNTISVAAEFRKKENEIMKLIGATNFMIRAPFVIEGFFIGLFGSVIPVIIVCAGYNKLMDFLVEKAKFLANIFEPISLKIIAVPMGTIAIIISCIVCMIVSFFTIRKHLKV